MSSLVSYEIQAKVTFPRLNFVSAGRRINMVTEIVALLLMGEPKAIKIPKRLLNILQHDLTEEVRADVHFCK